MNDGTLLSEEENLNIREDDFKLLLCEYCGLYGNSCKCGQEEPYYYD